MSISEENLDMLINFRSPETPRTPPHQNAYLKNPLIPGPDLPCNFEDNNPFDEVANSAQNWDPFELVLLESLKKVENAQKEADKHYRTSKTPSPKKSYNSRFPSLSLKKVARSQSFNENVTRSPSTNGETPCFDSPRKTVDDTSVFISKFKKRISKCFEKALNSSFSQPELRKNTSFFSKKNDILDSSSQTLSISVSENASLINSFSAGNHPRSTRSFSLTSYSKDELKRISEEAYTVSQAIESMCFVSPKKQNSSDEGEEDLMDLQPPWEKNPNILISLNTSSSDSSMSDESSIGLPKVKLFYTKKKKQKKQNEFSEEEIESYKKRIRNSIDGSMCGIQAETNNSFFLDNGKDESTVSENNLKNKQATRLDALSGCAPVLPDASDLKPKKVETVLKKGPLKAIVPLQKMTRSIAEKLSPLRKNSFKTKAESSFSSSGPFPVASSTPNGRTLRNPSVASVTPIVARPKSFRLARGDVKEESKKGGFRRSSSLSSETRNTKLPFTALNPNVKANGNTGLRRPHTAPSPHNSTIAKTSPFRKVSVRQRNLIPAAANDKENRTQVSLN